MPFYQAFERADFLPFAPVELLETSLVQAHQDVAFLLAGDAGNEFIGAKGAVGEKEFPLANVFEEARGHAGVVLLPATGLEAFPAATGEVGDAYDAHSRKSAARLLGRGLGVGLLVFPGVGELHRAAVDGFDGQSPALVPLCNALMEMAAGCFGKGFKELLGKVGPGLAVATSLRGRGGKLMNRTPGLDEADRFMTAGIGTKNLRKPGPEE